MKIRGYDWGVILVPDTMDELTALDRHVRGAPYDIAHEADPKEEDDRPSWLTQKQVNVRFSGADHFTCPLGKCLEVWR